jgi:hypothetical protein
VANSNPITEAGLVDGVRQMLRIVGFLDRLG